MSSSSRFLATIDVVLDLSDRSLLRLDDPGTCRTIASPDGTRIASVSRAPDDSGGGGIVRVFDATGAVRFEHRSEWFLSDLAFGEDGRTLIVPTQRFARHFAVESGRMQSGPRARLEEIARLPDGSFVATERAAADDPPTGLVWLDSDGETAIARAAPVGLVGRLQVAVSGTTILTVGQKHFHVWRLIR